MPSGRRPRHLEPARDHAREPGRRSARTAATVALDGDRSAARSRAPRCALGRDARRRRLRRAPAAPGHACCASTDVDGDACVHARRLQRRRHRPSGSNVADTVKVQWQAYLGPGALLLSDMGRVLMTHRRRTRSGRHDALCGRDRPGDYGATARRRAGPSPTARAAGAGRAKHGLDRRDLARAQPVQAGVRVADDGSLIFDGARAARAARGAAGRAGRDRARWPTCRTRSTRGRATRAASCASPRGAATPTARTIPSRRGDARAPAGLREHRRPPARLGVRP